MTLRRVFEHVAYLRAKGSLEDLHAFLCRNGWDHRYLNGNMAIVHPSPCRRFVLKYSRRHRMLNLPSREQLERFPMLREHWLRPILWTPKVAVQPFACPAAKHDSVPLRNRLFEVYGSYMDVCDNNVGHWRGKLWIFDCTPPRTSAL